MLKNVKSVILDADETLWDCDRFYAHALDRFVAIMIRHGFSEMDIRIWCRDKNRERQAKNQIGVPYFHQSLQEIYCTKLSNPKDLEELSNVFFEHCSHPMVIKPGVRQNLLDLSHAGMKLYLYTQGHKLYQNRLVNRSGLRNYFTRVAIVPKKDAPTLERILQDWDLDPTTVLIVGDSYRYDIAPPLELGLLVVLLGQTPGLASTRDAYAENNSRLLMVGGLDEITRALVGNSRDHQGR